MISVDEFLKEQESKPVLLHVYSYYDTKLEQFNQPQIEERTPDFMATAVRAGLVKGTFKPEQASGLLFVYLGTFDIKSGTFDIFPEAKIIVDCDRVLNNGGNQA